MAQVSSPVCRASIAPSSAATSPTARNGKGKKERSAGAAAVRRRGVVGWSGASALRHTASGPYMQLAGKCIAGGDAGREASSGESKMRSKTEREAKGSRGGEGECTHKVDI